MTTHLSSARRWPVWTALGLAALLPGCASIGSGPSAVAALQPTQGNTASGEVRFVQQGGRLAVTARIAGLKPNQAHGFHVHEKGDCGAPDFSSAGEHFATSPKLAHGMPADAHRHTGDLGNIVVDGNGTASVDRKDAIISLDGDRSIIGRALIVHERGDDGTDAKSAGGRLLCGVIERADLGALPERGNDAPTMTVPSESVPAQARDNTIPPLTAPPPVVP